MKFSLARFFVFVVFLACTKHVFADTWYVRADGAPHYSANIANLSWRGLDPKHTCDGTHDAPFPAVGTTNVLGDVSDGQNQPCALSDWRWLYDDQGSYGQLNWIIAGGDTVILDNTKAWRVGREGDDTNAGADPWCWGWNGGPFGCFNPVVPAGTAQQHTRILGRNWASCSTANGQPDKTKMSELFGGHGVSVTLNLASAQYVDVQCLEITRHSQCTLHGDPMYPAACRKSGPMDDYDKNGMWTDTGTHDLLLQDIWDHGHTERGIIGPIGGLVTANRVDISTNGMAGWDFDDGASTPSVNATLKMSYSAVEWSGCNQQYPATSPIPVLSCYGQSNAGYGDGVATPSGSGMDVYVDHSTFHHNTQEGLDLLHVDTGQHTLQITNSAAFANNGQQFKWGGNMTSVLFANNIVVGNCLRMSQPISGAPNTYNANLGDFCRAQDTLRFNLEQNANVLLANNTVISYTPTIFDMSCTDSSCSNATLTMSNNIVRGYDNATTYNMGGRDGGPGLFYSDSDFGTFNRDHNVFYGVRGACVANKVVYGTQGTATAENCIDPDFVNEPGSMSSESMFDTFNFALDSGSSAQYAGASIGSITIDFDGKQRSNPPSLGALEAGSQATLDALYPAGATLLAVAAPAAPVATSTLLDASAVPSVLDNATFTVTVVPASGAAAPQGTVSLYFGTYALATATLDGNGTASWVYPAFIQKLGLVAKYDGNAKFAGSSSSVLNSSSFASK